ncbi:hypothetical protein BJV78DRAFT_1155228 [Lactifluus subvellereus]|nr:hypothetical protein BJV78DRAFT_1155228 [Lactifluus subvellereus]
MDSYSDSVVWLPTNLESLVRLHVSGSGDPPEEIFLLPIVGKCECHYEVLEIFLKQDDSLTGPAQAPIVIGPLFPSRLLLEAFPRLAISLPYLSTKPPHGAAAFLCTPLHRVFTVGVQLFSSGVAVGSLRHESGRAKVAKPRVAERDNGAGRDIDLTWRQGITAGASGAWAGIARGDDSKQRGKKGEFVIAYLSDEADPGVRLSGALSAFVSGSSYDSQSPLELDKLEGSHYPSIHVEIVDPGVARHYSGRSRLTPDFVTRIFWSRRSRMTVTVGWGSTIRPSTMSHTCSCSGSLNAKDRKDVTQLLWWRLPILQSRFGHGKGTLPVTQGDVFSTQEPQESGAFFISLA